MAAAQPFISGAISKTGTSRGRERGGTRDAYMEPGGGLKAIALYREAANAPTGTTADRFGRPADGAQLAGPPNIVRRKLR